MSEQKANPAAVTLGKLRWKGKSKQERSEFGRALAIARWGKRREAETAIEGASEWQTTKTSENRSGRS